MNQKKINFLCELYIFILFFLLQQEASISMESGIQSDHINNKIIKIKLNILTYSSTPLTRSLPSEQISYAIR